MQAFGSGRIPIFSSGWFWGSLWVAGHVHAVLPCLVHTGAATIESVQGVASFELWTKNDPEFLDFLS
jgi:hypothetical protein